MALQGMQHGALGDRMPGGLVVAQPGRQCPDLVVASAALQHDDAGANGRAHRLQRQDLGDLVCLVHAV
jgi:hypothetical protein